MKVVEGKKIYSVSEVNYFAKQTLEQMYFWLEAEISSIRKNPNWSFYYLDLKDSYATLPAIAEEFMIKNLGDDIVGQKVLVFGSLSLHQPFGKYQFKISSIESAGEGILQKQLNELIKKLRSEGLFEKKFKKEIPKYPTKVCIVTSIGSDAYNDFVRHSVEKFPAIELHAADVRVQGFQAIPDILKTLPLVDKKKFDVIVITRGGGSIEDLAAFNDEQVARMIFSLKTPTVVAIGHETNESLAEWVADVRASTPTDAAHIITTGYQTLLESLDYFGTRLRSSAASYFSVNFQLLDHVFFKISQARNSFNSLPDRLKFLHESLKRHEGYLVADSKSKLHVLIEKLDKGIHLQTQNKAQTLKNLNNSLLLLSPENTLSRGYSITTAKNGRVISTITNVVVDSEVGVRLADGKFTSKVISKE